MSRLIPRGLYPLLACALFTCLAGARAAESAYRPPAADRILQSLKPDHPRLLIDATTLVRIKDLAATDTLVTKCLDNVRADAKSLLDAAPSKYEIPDGRRLLSVSRQVVDRVQKLGLVYLLDGGAQYRDRAWKELEAAANFKDWNPSHFLDTAEMTYAFAIGYDWFYADWTPEQRTILVDAIARLGLDEAMKVYESGTWWPTSENNWNQVCNGGIGMGALAIADVRPELARTILAHALGSLPLAMSHYAPDGAGTEGVTYWDYGTRYNVLLLAGLQSALGTDFGLSDIPGFADSGNYQRYLSGANALSFNFADCGLSQVGTPQHFWMATRFARPEFSAFRLDRLRADGAGGVLDLLWYDDSGASFDPKTLPLDKYYSGAETASMRSAWNDPDALVLAIQAGDSMNLGGHRHLDLGSFILEADGVRWIIDSGTDHETYMAHVHHNPRHAYYRIRAEGHNTLVLNPADGPDQNPKAVAKIVAFSSTPDKVEAVVDLSQAYEDHASKVTRTFLLRDQRTIVEVTDTLEAKQPADLWWFLQTEAQVAIAEEGRVAVPTQGGKKIAARIVAPEGAAFTVGPAKPLPTSPNPTPQEGNEGRSRLAIHLKDVKEMALTVRFESEQ